MQSVKEIIKESEDLLAKFGEQLTKISKQFTQVDLELAVKRAFDFRIQRCKKMIEDSYSDYSKSAAKGIPYNERLSLVDKKKIAWSESELKRLQQLRENYIVKPFEYWLHRGDYEYMKTVGFYRFLELHLEEAIYVKGDYKKI